MTPNLPIPQRKLGVGVGLFLFLLGWAVSRAAFADFSGYVVGVHDGDTLTVLVDRRQVKVRLSEIDAPELKQAFGKRSKQSLASLCYDKPARVLGNSQDRYGRALGRVICAGNDANAERIRRGMAWVYDRYSKPESPLYRLNSAKKP